MDHCVSKLYNVLDAVQSLITTRKLKPNTDRTIMMIDSNPLQIENLDLPSNSTVDKTGINLSKKSEI